MPSQTAHRIRPEWGYLDQLRLAYPQLTDLDRRLQKAQFTIELLLRDDHAASVTDSLQQLDTSFRLAGRLLHRRGDLGKAPEPVSVRVAGLRVVDARSGSIEMVLVAYGAAEAWATAHPIALAFLTAAVVAGPKQLTRIRRWLYDRKKKTGSTADQPAEEVSFRLTRAPDGSLQDFTVVRKTRDTVTDAGAKVTVKVETASEKIELEFVMGVRGGASGYLSAYAPSLGIRVRRRVS